MSREIKVGTRDSILALIQTNSVVKSLKQIYPEYSFKILNIKTKGDKIQNVALAKIGDKGLFTEELELALLNKEIDFAVHSMKDIPTALPKKLKIGAICERINPSDIIVSKDGLGLEQLRKGALIGTSSLRRTSQILNYRPDFNVISIRGNINTRLEKLQKEEYDAIIIAAAGLVRMEFEDKITEYIPFDISLPAIGQGSLGIEIREGDGEIIELLKKINHSESEVAITAERSMLRRLEGGCQIPIGAYAEVVSGKIKLRGMIGSPDGKRIVRSEITGLTSEAELVGQNLANILLENGGKEILEKLKLETVKE